MGNTACGKEGLKTVGAGSGWLTLSSHALDCSPGSKLVKSHKSGSVKVNLMKGPIGLCACSVMSASL